eukprot:CAMPEP_0198285966 /NCGR_PEP_ID=MMETSP1449-20131203/5175_1 /TAXON_ID=420275 /ORGANISM="Attheya septentrionalis, Strain CCMP2084" /LENGTH=364 /DNA_ID=CAMNT_0043983585 /DNA_START=67 /DNA_END=1161 /DNA_ORIENTATION=+
MNDHDSHPGGSGDYVKTFPEKLMKILSTPEYASAIVWQPHGRSFLIISPERLTSDVLPHYFKRCKFSSFIRKLYRWGFRQITKGADTHSYFHRLFQRGNMALCMQMRCQDRNAPNKPGSEFIPPYDLSAEPAEMMDRRMSTGSKAGDISAQQEIKPEGADNSSPQSTGRTQVTQGGHDALMYQNENLATLQAELAVTLQKAEVIAERIAVARLQQQQFRRMSMPALGRGVAPPNQNMNHIMSNMSHSQQAPNMSQMNQFGLTQARRMSLPNSLPFPVTSFQQTNMQMRGMMNRPPGMGGVGDLTGLGDAAVRRMSNAEAGMNTPGYSQLQQLQQLQQQQQQQQQRIPQSGELIRAALAKQQQGG